MKSGVTLTHIARCEQPPLEVIEVHPTREVVARAIASLAHSVRARIRFTPYSRLAVMVCACLSAGNKCRLSLANVRDERQTTINNHEIVSKLRRRVYLRENILRSPQHEVQRATVASRWFAFVPRRAAPWFGSTRSARLGAARSTRCTRRFSARRAARVARKRQCASVSYTYSYSH